MREHRFWVWARVSYCPLAYLGNGKFEWDGDWLYRAIS